MDHSESREREIHEACLVAAYFQCEILDPPPSPLEEWRDAFSGLADLQEGYFRDEINGRSAFRKALSLLKPLVGRAGARAIIHSAVDPAERTKVSFTRRKGTALHPATRKTDAWFKSQIMLEGLGLAMMVCMRDGRTKDQAAALIAGKRLREFAQGWKGDLLFSTSIDTLLDMWKDWRKMAVERGYADPRLPVVMLKEQPVPSDAVWLDGLPKPGPRKGYGVKTS